MKLNDAKQCKCSQEKERERGREKRLESGSVMKNEALELLQKCQGLLSPSLSPSHPPSLPPPSLPAYLPPCSPASDERRDIQAPSFSFLG